MVAGSASGELVGALRALGVDAWGVENNRAIHAKTPAELREFNRLGSVNKLPFEDGAFDLVLNRHGGFRAAEMHRILQPGGVFLTQQVGGDNLADLVAAFGGRLAYPDNTLGRVCEDLVALGCEIQLREAWRGPVAFLDVGALVYFLKAIPWVIEGFEVERSLDVLGALHRQLQAGRPLEFTYSRFLVRAVRA